MAPHLYEHPMEENLSYLFFKPKCKCPVKVIDKVMQPNKLKQLNQATNSERLRLVKPFSKLKVDIV